MPENKNNKKKLFKYKKFWSRSELSRPLVGYDIGGYDLFQRYSILKNYNDKTYLQLKDIVPEEFLMDYEKFLQKSHLIKDDLIRGVAPLPVFPWLEAILGCEIQMSGDSIWAKERHADWSELEDLKLSNENKWLKKYLDFINVLSNNFGEEYPVGQPIMRGITDIIGVLRGHTQGVMDCIENPDLIHKLANNIADIYIQVIKMQYEIIKSYKQGYFLEQYSLWVPDKIVRIQEDATALYSPDIYNDLIQEYDKRIASAFPYSLLHLHTSSLFLIDNFLEIDNIDVFQITRDVGVSITDFLPALKKIQNNNKLLLIRGPMSEKELLKIENHLSSTGLFIQIVVDSLDDIKKYKKLINNIWK